MGGFEATALISRYGKDHKLKSIPIISTVYLVISFPDTLNVLSISFIPWMLNASALSTADKISL